MLNRKKESLLPLGSDSKGYSKIASSKSCAVADTAKDAAGFKLLQGYMGLLFHLLSVTQDLFCETAFQPAAPSLCFSMRLVYPRYKTLH